MDTTLSPTAASNPFLTVFLGARLMLGVLLIIGMIVPDLAFAQSSGEEFESIYATIRGWMTGTFGKLISLAAILVGLTIGVVKQSAMAAVIGVAIALVLVYSPGVIETLFDVGAAAGGV